MYIAYNTKIAKFFVCLPGAAIAGSLGVRIKVFEGLVALAAKRRFSGINAREMIEHRLFVHRSEEAMQLFFGFICAAVTRGLGIRALDRDNV